MQYLNEDQVTQLMGVGYLGEVRQGPDGYLYQYVQGVDGLGNPIGAWWKRLARRVVRRALPLARQFAPFIPGGAAALTAATPFLKQAGVAGDGLGALYQAPDGTLYQQVQGLADEADLRGLGEDQATQMMGVGYLGEVRQGPDGNLYQYTQGIDGLGNPLGSWWRRLARRALPFAQQFAPFIPGGAAALTAATPFLKQAGVAGYEGLDDDEEALRGLEEDAELRGLDDDELRGLNDEEALRGLEEDAELRGLDADEALQGLDDDEALRGIGEGQDMQGVEGYVRRDGMNGLEAFVPQEPPQTRWHTASPLPSEVWKPLW